MVISDRNSYFPVQPAERRRCFQRETCVNAWMLSQATVGGWSPLSTDPKAGWLRKSYLGIRRFSGTPEPYPTCQRVRRKCVSVWDGLELQSECGDFLPFLKLAI